MFFMEPFRVHIIHVGNMANKGTQALLNSDVSLIRDVVGPNVEISVSTTDVEGVRKLDLSLEAVFSPIIDIPYEWADYYARRFGFSRASWKYKVFALWSLFFMPVQMLLSVVSVIFVKHGLRPIFRSDLLQLVKGSSVVVSYSDENFKEGTSLLPLNIYWILTWWSMLVSRMWDVLVAKFLGKPVVMFPNSVGPFRTWVGRILAWLALSNFNVVLIREPVSYEIVESLGIGVQKILTSDTALLLDSSDRNSVGGLSSPVLGVSAGIYSHSLSRNDVDRYIEAHARALDEAVRRYGFSVVFLPHYVSGFPSDDLEISKLILSRMKNKAQIVDASDVRTFKSLLGQMDIVVSSKMHPAVLAVASCVPTVCIAYDHKQVGFFERLCLRGCVLPVYAVSEEALLSRISHVWGMRDDIKAKLKERVPLLKADIKTAVERVLRSFVRNGGG